MQVDIRSFFDELEKIAAKKRKKEGLSHDPAVGAVAGAGGVMAANTAFAAGSLASAHNPKKHNVTEADIQEMAKGMGHPGGLHADVKQAPSNIASRMADMNHQPHFRVDTQRPIRSSFASSSQSKTTRPTVNVPIGSHPAMAAHEVGHAVNHARYGHLGTNTAYRLSMTAGMPSTLLTSGMAGGQEDPSWAPGLANAAIWSPVMAEESAASLRAAKYFTKKHGLAAGLKKSLPLAPALASYGSLALGPLAITAGRKLHARAKRKKQERG